MDFKMKSIFKYPAVEYIPLYLTTIRKRYDWRYPIEEEMIIVYEQQEYFIKKLASYNIKLPTNKLTEDDILFVGTLNFNVNEIAYRGNKITLLGETTKNMYHLFTLPKKYFYKTLLHFEAYNQQGEKAAIFNINLHQKRESLA